LFIWHKTGAISAAVTEKYHIDKTLPTGEVKLNGRTYKGKKSH